MKNKITIPAMTREEYDQQPEAFRYFHPYERARKPLTIKTVKPPAKARDGYRYFTEGRR